MKNLRWVVIVFCVMVFVSGCASMRGFMHNSNKKINETLDKVISSPVRLEYETRDTHVGKVISALTPNDLIELANILDRGKNQSRIVKTKGNPVYDEFHITKEGYKEMGNLKEFSNAKIMVTLKNGRRERASFDARYNVRLGYWLIVAN